MFRRRWSGLPADPIFGSNLAEIGYFVNEVDEIRSLDDPDDYFKFFLTKNDRWNQRQRFCFNQAIGTVLRSRMEAEGLKKVLLPLGTTDPEKPHVEIRVSEDIDKKSRVVIIFGEFSQELGVLAHRVIGGPGGVNKGSMVGLVREIKKQKSSATDDAPPGIILTNPGELHWWPEGRRGLTPTARHAIPLASAVHYGRRYDPEQNHIPENRNVGEHVRYIFDKVVPAMVLGSAKIDVIAVADVAEEVEAYLNKDAAWGKLADQMNTLTIVGGNYDEFNIDIEGFKSFLGKRARAYIMDQRPVGTHIARADGAMIDGESCTAYGCPVFSTGEETIVTEMMLINAQQVILKWIQQASLEEDKFETATELVAVENSIADAKSGLAALELGEAGSENGTDVKE